MRAQTELFNKAISVYTNELRQELNNIIKHVIHEFNVEMVGTELNETRLIEAMIGRPIVYCGGGSVFSNMRISNHYFTDKRIINKDILNIPNLLNRDLSPVYYTILATAYGLSIPIIEEIKTIDARQLWESIAENVRNAPVTRKEVPDYGLSDD